MVFWVTVFTSPVKFNEFFSSKYGFILSKFFEKNWRTTDTPKCATRASLRSQGQSYRCYFSRGNQARLDIVNTKKNIFCCINVEILIKNFNNDNKFIRMNKYKQSLAKKKPIIWTIGQIMTVKRSVKRGVEFLASLGQNKYLHRFFVSFSRFVGGPTWKRRSSPFI